MGDSGVFYKPKLISALAQSLTDQGISLLAFNNRGAHNSKILYRDVEGLTKAEQRYQAGTHYELIVDCLKDISGATEYLQSEGYKKLYLGGHSTGANKVCVYDSLTESNPFTKYVLAGPGDDTGLNYMALGKKKFKLALEHARLAISNGKPLKVMPAYTGMNPFSAQSADDILDPNGSYNSFPFYEAVNGPLGDKVLFKEFQSIKTPMLIIAGSQDGASASAGSTESALNILKANMASKILNRSDIQLITGSNHTFDGYENEFAERVTSWLSQ
jgi:pimeloyl-ACP methyl ester carboxylesterase